MLVDSQSVKMYLAYTQIKDSDMTIFLVVNVYITGLFDNVWWKRYMGLIGKSKSVVE